MSAIRLHLKPEKDKSGNQLIMLTYQNHGERFRHSSGYKINLRFWDASKQKVKGTHNLSSEINLDLEHLKNRISKIELDAKNNGIIPGKEYIKDQLNKINLTTKKLELFDFIEMFIRESNSTPGTKKIYNNTLNHLAEYAKLTKQTLSFNKMTFEFYEKFSAHLFKAKQLNGNSVGKVIKTLKSFLNNASEKGLIDKVNFGKFKVISQSPDIVYLTNQELQSLLEVDLSEKLYLDRVRDVFCFCCFTGLRFSDVKALKREQIELNQIHITTQKTNQTINIPLVSAALRILNKYQNDYKPLPVPSNVKMNEYLKDLCEVAKIDKPTVVVKFKGNERIDSTIPKYKLITTHTARRTFVTLALESGMRPEALMKITGHSTTKEFYKYVIITPAVAQLEFTNAFQRFN